MKKTNDHTADQIDELVHQLKAFSGWLAYLEDLKDLKDLIQEANDLKRVELMLALADKLGDRRPLLSVLTNKTAYQAFHSGLDLAIRKMIHQLDPQERNLNS